MARILTLIIAVCICAVCICAGPIASAQPPQSSSPHPEEAAILALVDRFMLAVGDKDPARWPRSASRAGSR